MKVLRFRISYLNIYLHCHHSKSLSLLILRKSYSLLSYRIHKIHSLHFSKFPLQHAVQVIFIEIDGKSLQLNQYLTIDCHLIHLVCMLNCPKSILMYKMHKFLNRVQKNSSCTNSCCEKLKLLMILPFPY